MPPPGDPSPYGGSGPAGNVGAGGFFSALFDFSFNEFITPKVVKFVYVLATIALALLWLLLVISAFVKSAGAGLAVLIIGGIGAILYLALIRMTLEFYLAIVRMSEDIHHRMPPR
jgi:hypothetical protein